MATKSKLEEGPNKPKATNVLEFKVAFDGKPAESIQFIGYAFDRQGNLLASAPVRNDLVKLSLSAEQARSARLFFAPTKPGLKIEKDISLDGLESLRAYEASWSFDIKKQVYELLPIPEYYWKWWLFCKCRVRGQVVKPVSIAGVLTDLPVCEARVHICEVDPFIWLIPRLPDPIVIRLRDELLRAIEWRWPIPLPDPPPFQFDPGVIDPSPLNLARMNKAAMSAPANRFTAPSVELNPQPEPPAPGRAIDVMLNPQPFPPAPDPFGEVMLNPQPLPPRENVSAVMQLSLETRSALNSPSAQTVRQALVDNVVLIRPYLCYWPWLWPWLCRCDEIAVVNTDAHGRFDTNIWYWCYGDHPDLYFWVEYPIGGTWTTVYHPNPICCYTYWDYVCGSDVLIRVSDPRVTPCGNPPPDLAGLQVAILSIGNNVSMSEIPVDSSASAPLSGSTTEGLANGTSPFGGQLEPHVNFSRSALIAANITHYRWSYRQLTQGDGSTPLTVADTWHIMDRQVIRHYQVYNPITSTLSYPVFNLGPDPAYPGLSLFKIQPINAPTGYPEDWVPNVDAREDSASAFFLSHLTQGGNAVLGAGKYEFKFELFNTSGATPAVVDFTSSGIALKVSNVPAPFGSGTVTFDDADDHHRFKNGAGHTVAFRLVLRVDNIPTQAAIYQVYVDSPANLAGPCGFINYAHKHSSLAHVSFKAHHPHKFATFGFTVVKGSTGSVAAASDIGQVNLGGTDVHGFANVPASGLYSKDVPVAQLLDANGVTCNKAAFGETLHVDAMATDGWGSLDYLDSDGMPMAFALEP
ncbi:MAG TPA: hypothetical protein VGK00_04925 [Anaerolineales bacterium]|jgi:hypothetical protein